ncbi:site-2 protease family protein [Sphingopyxis sp.]|uniref:site-2 protease family protein n=1 Tax=Sphingopyxis sp. TaxID=1908224 RepID=UPI002DEE756A|nr:site-2 protease family protein [Sphingopyxis sp.]
MRLILTLMLIGGLHEYAPPSWGAYGVLIAFLCLSFLVTMVHELGHALAVWGQRGTVIEISVLGLTYAPPSRRFALKALPKGGDLGGYVAYRPPAEDWTRRQYGIVAAAGPLADAALALVALTTAMWFAPPIAASPAPVVATVVDEASANSVRIRSNLPSTEEHERIVAEISAGERGKGAAALASMLMVVAFVSALGNLLPYHGSDGARLLQLWRGRNRFARTR